MKITIILKNEFKKNDLKLLALLEDNLVFEKIIKLIRKMVGLPVDGLEAVINKEKRIKISEKNQEVLKNMNQINPKLFKKIESLISIYNLPYSWKNTLYSIIIFNIALPPMRNKTGFKTVEVQYAGGLQLLSRNLRNKYDNFSDFETRIEITIREGMSFGELIKELKKQKPDVDRYLKYLHKTPKILIKNIKIKKEILELTKTLKDCEIGQLLDTKYGSKLSFEPHYETISKYRNRYLKEVNKIPVNKYSLYYLDKILETGQ